MTDLHPPRRSGPPEAATPQQPRRRPDVDPALMPTPDELEALTQADLERLTTRAQMALGAAKRERAALTSSRHLDHRRLAVVNRRVAALGSTVAALCARRSALRQAQRREQGGLTPTMEAAIARAAAAVLSERDYKKVLRAAESIVRRAKRDAGGSRAEAT